MRDTYLSFYCYYLSYRIFKLSAFMELFIALGLPLVMLVGLTLLFMTDGVPDWIQNLTKNSSNIWNFGIVAMSTMMVIIYLAKR